MSELVYCSDCWKHIGKPFKAWGRDFLPCNCEVPNPDGGYLTIESKCGCEGCFINEPCMVGLR